MATILRVYWAGPISGGILAAVFYTMIIRAPRPPPRSIRSAVPLGSEDPAQEAILNHDADAAHAGDNKEVIVDRTSSI